MKRCVAAVLGAALLVLPASASAERLSAFPALSGTVVEQTEFSDTTVSSDGRRHTQVAPFPINFKNEAGDWEAIDTSLVSAGGGDLRPAALEGDALIPPTLAEPVSVEHDGREITFQLRGASGVRSQADGQAKFAEALPGVDVLYQARSLGVKETIVLKSASAPRVFTYDLRSEDDLTAAVRGGAIVLSDDEGKERFRIDAPAAWDSAVPASYSNAIDLEIDKTGTGHWVVTVAPDQAWLNAPNRVYPVSIDPDYYWMNATVMRFHGATDCFLQNTNANTNFCATTVTKATRKGSTVAKPIFKFDVSTAIPSNANVTKARFFAYAPGTVGRVDHDMRLKTITADWDSTATWNNRKTGVPWTTPGGDVSTDPALTGPPAAVGYAGYYYGWDAPLQTVKHWVDGTLPNHGFLLDPDTYADPSDPNNSDYLFTTTESTQTTQWPLLDVTWTAPDVTPPGAPSNLEVSGFDFESGKTELFFKDGIDSPPSTVQSQMRLKLNGGAFSSWAAAVSPAELPGVQLDDAVTVEVRTLDAAGNVSPTTTLSFEARVFWNEDAYAAMASDYVVQEFGFSRAVANEWVAVQAATSDLRTDIDNDSDASEYFAGLWFDNEARRVNISVTNSAGLTSLQTLVNARGLTASVDYHTVPWSESQLLAATQSAQGLLQSDIDDGWVDVAYSAAYSGVTFELASGASTAVRARVSAARTSLSPIATEVDEVAASRFVRQPLACQDLRLKSGDLDVGCDPPVRGGVRIETNLMNGDPYACSSGFNVQSRSDDKYYVLTAGHCLWSFDEKDLGYPVRVQRGFRIRTKSDVNGRTLGDWHSYMNPSLGGDAALIEIKDSYLLGKGVAPWVYMHRTVIPAATGSVKRNEHFAISEARKSAPGEVLCMSGAVTGGRCGRIPRKKAFGYANGNRARISTCGAREGDSGGPVVGLSTTGGGTGRGILSNFPDKDNRPCLLEFQSLTVALEAAQVDLVIAGQAAGFPLRQCPKYYTWVGGTFGCQAII